MHPKFMLFLMFIKRIRLKMQSESENHPGNFSFTPLLHQFVSSEDNKMQLIEFIVNQWQCTDRIKNTNPNIFYQLEVRNVITCEELV